MARRRFFVDAVRDSKAELAGDDARHLTRVLRAEVGQRFEISDNQAVYLAEISSLQKDRVSFHIVQSLDFEEQPVELTLFVSLIKFDRLEWIIEKATELGVNTIVPVNAERSDKGLFEAAQKRVGRWRKIARESSQQSRRLRLPVIRVPESLSTVLSEPSRHRYFLEENPGAPPLLRALGEPADRGTPDQVSLLIGPEGGWTDRERAQMTSAHWIPVSVGPSILRSETAAIAALAIVSHSCWARTRPPRTP